MDFSWDTEADAMAEAAAELGRRDLNHGLAERDQAGELSLELWRKCADFGVLGLPVPRNYGGTEQPLTTTVRTLEALGYGCRDNGLLFALGAQMWSVQIPLLLYGSDAQKERYLPALVSGEMIGAHAVTESEAGSDTHALRTTASTNGSGWVLNGSKAFITSAPIAGVYLVLASTNGDQASRGLSAFLVEQSAAGLSVAPPYAKIGLRTSPMAEVSFSDCRVGADAMLGKPGAGATVFATAMEWERAFILAPALGGMKRQLEDCVAQARARWQFGRPISKNDAVSHKLVDMQLRLDSARLLMYHTAWLKQSGKRLTREPSQVKLKVSESWAQNCLDALQIHGASGYIDETGIGRDLTAALASKIYSGTSEIQRRIVARYMGL